MKYELTIIIDGKGKFLIPGLIDTHIHTMFEFITMRKSYKFMLLCGFFLFLLLNPTKGQPKRTNKKTTTTVSNNFNIEISHAVANDSLRLIEIF